jgi:hypothetical protein
MSRDPAFLFYSSDFLTGTLTMTHEQVGKYVRLLCMQHQQGRLSDSDMKYICKRHDEKIYAKFIKGEDNYYRNDRLKLEMERRIKYSESRRKNRIGS